MNKEYKGMSPATAAAAIELDAARELFEKTGRSYFKLNQTEQRKVIEKFEEEHGISR